MAIAVGDQVYKAFGFNVGGTGQQTSPNPPTRGVYAVAGAAPEVNWENGTRQVFPAGSFPQLVLYNKTNSPSAAQQSANLFQHVEISVLTGAQRARTRGFIVDVFLDGDPGVTLRAVVKLDSGLGYYIANVSELVAV